MKLKTALLGAACALSFFDTDPRAKAHSPVAARRWFNDGEDTIFAPSGRLNGRARQGC